MDWSQVVGGLGWEPGDGVVVDPHDGGLPGDRPPGLGHPAEVGGVPHEGVEVGQFPGEDCLLIILLDSSILQRLEVSGEDCLLVILLGSSILRRLEVSPMKM